MGQKINSIGFRLGVRRSWNSVWSTENNFYSNVLFNDLESRDCIKVIFNYLGFFPNHLLIRKSSKKKIVYTRILDSLNFVKRSDFIVQKNKNIKYLSPFLNKTLFNIFKFKFSSLKNLLAFKNIKNYKKLILFPFISAQSLTEFISTQQNLQIKQKNKIFRWGLKWGIIKLAHFFFNSKTTIFLSGVKFICSGRWIKTKSGRKQKFIYSLGKLKNQTISAFLDYGFSSLVTKYGICSVKVWISYKHFKFSEK